MLQLVTYVLTCSLGFYREVFFFLLFFLQIFQEAATGIAGMSKESILRHRRVDWKSLKQRLQFGTSIIFFLFFFPTTLLPH